MTNEIHELTEELINLFVGKPVTQQELETINKLMLFMFIMENKVEMGKTTVH